MERSPLRRCPVDVVDAQHEQPERAQHPADADNVGALHLTAPAPRLLFPRPRPLLGAGRLATNKPAAAYSTTNAPTGGQAAAAAATSLASNGNAGIDRDPPPFVSPPSTTHPRDVRAKQLKPLDAARHAVHLPPVRTRLCPSDDAGTRLAAYMLSPIDCFFCRTGLTWNR